MASISSRTTTTQINLPSTSKTMFPLNKRHTEALEKTAEAKKRLAAAEEAIARDLGAYLEGEDNEQAESAKATAGKKVKKPDPDVRKA